MAILGTSNCFLAPLEEYRDRMFSTGPVYLPGVKHIDGYDYSEVIAKARALPELPEAPGDYMLTTGFSASSLISHAAKIKQLVLDGKIKRFFLVGGCDGPSKKWGYYREFVQKLPKDIDRERVFAGKVDAKLANPAFLASAPAEIVEKEREKYRDSVLRAERLARYVEDLT